MSSDEGELPPQVNTVTCGERLSKVIEQKFMFELSNAEKLLPIRRCETQEEKDQMRKDMLSCLFDYLFGTAIAIGCHYASTEETFEEYVVDLVRDKIEILRKMKEARSDAVVN